MYLVDTSVWVDYLRGNPTRQVGTLRELLAGEEIVGVAPIILQEVLQGADSIERLDGLSHLFLAMASDYATRLSAEDKKWHNALTREGIRPDLSDLDRVLSWLRKAKVEGTELLNKPLR